MAGLGKSSCPPRPQTPALSLKDKTTCRQRPRRPVRLLREKARQAGASGLLLPHPGPLQTNDLTQCAFYTFRRSTLSVTHSPSPTQTGSWWGSLRRRAGPRRQQRRRWASRLGLLYICGCVFITVTDNTYVCTKNCRRVCVPFLFNQPREGFRNTTKNNGCSKFR